jgi:hypothetical protein
MMGSIREILGYNFHLLFDRNNPELTKPYTGDYKGEKDDK